MRRHLIGTLLAGLLLAALPCKAAELTSENDERLRMGLERFPAADTDGDGILTQTEALAFIRQRRERQQKKAGATYAQLPPTHADVAYGPHDRNRLDLWLADAPDGGATPLAVFIHGGGFVGGDKSKVSLSNVRRLLDAGVSVATINYRLLDSGPYPIPMHDGARALQYLRLHADEYNLDKERFACYGGSAGACMSMWLAMHHDLADADAEDPVLHESSRILCAGPVAGQSTLDFHVFQEWFGDLPLREHPSLRPLFGVQDAEELERPEIRKLMADASPITHASADDPPIYAAYGQPNSEITPESSPGEWVHHPRLGIKLKERLDELGVECWVQYPGGPKVEAYKDVVDFLIRKLTAK